MVWVYVKALLLVANIILDVWVFPGIGSGVLRKRDLSLGCDDDRLPFRGLSLRAKRGDLWPQCVKP